MTENVHPDLTAGLRRLPSFSASRWNLPILRLAIRLRDAARRTGPGVRVTTVTHSGVRLRVWEPESREPRAALLWIHGGGLIFGTAAGDDARCARYVRELDLLVVSPDYRLAPRHRFPAALDDCHAAWRWMDGRAAELGIDAARLAIGGESAGGGLAACLAQRIHDEGGTQPAAQLLVYPMLDDRTVRGANGQGAADSNPEAPEPATASGNPGNPPPPESGQEQPHLVWNRMSNTTGWKSYLGTDHAWGQNGFQAPPYAAAARREDLSGLPAAWIGVGTLDLFLKEDRTYAARLQDAGVECAFHLVVGAFHGFESVMPESPVSIQFADEQIDFLKDRLGC